MVTGAVIVAAGMSTRMKQFKQLMEIGDLTFAERVVTNFHRAGVTNIVMVTGYQAEQVETRLSKLGITFIRNDAYETTQMFDSAKLGLGYFNGKVDRLFFCPVDVPFFREDTVRIELTRPEKIVLPICSNRIGHPILIDGSLIPKIIAYEGPRGMKGALDSLGETICYLPVQDEGAVMDCDTKEDYERLIDLQNASLVQATVEVTFVNTQPFFDSDAAALLTKIDELNSVAEACKAVDISYSKGWRVIRTAEKGLGYRLVARKAGGKNGGQASLTDRGRELLECYERLALEMNEDVRKRFSELTERGSLFPHVDTLTASRPLSVQTPKGGDGQ